MKTVIPAMIINDCDVVRIERRIGRVRIVFTDDSEIVVFGSRGVPRVVYASPRDAPCCTLEDLSEEETR
jgi:hypothetical protein